MLCSICRQVEIVVNDSVAAACPNNHVHCPNCLGAVSERCLICMERLYEYNSTRVNDTRIWSPEVIRECSRKNALNLSISEDSLDGGVDDDETASVKLLYSRHGVCGSKSLHPSVSVKHSDHFLPQQFPNGQQPVCTNSLRWPVKTDVNLNPIRKDTRQALVEQTKQDLRKQLIEEIFKPYSPDQRNKLSAQKCCYVKYLRTIGVSTESTPQLHSLNSSSQEGANEKKLPKDNAVLQTFYRGAPAKYLLMNIDTNVVKNPHMSDDIQKKTDASSVDLRLQQVMGTLLESVKSPSKDDQHFYKFLRDKLSGMPLGRLEEIISSIYNGVNEGREAEVQVSAKSEQVAEKRLGPTLTPNCRRAFYNPPTGITSEVPPSPQFKLIKLCNVNISRDLVPREIIDGSLNIPRTPVTCPISTCQRTFFVSDFTKHIAVDHPKVLLEGIHPQQCKNFFLDPKLIHFGKSRCQVLLLVKDKIKNLGHEKFKDFIPILVMTTRLSLLEICSKKHREEVRSGTQNFVMIWMTGIMPPHLPLFFSLTVWARSGAIPFCHLVHSGRLYSVRESQSPGAVWQSGQMLLLSNNQIEFLTNGGRRMLELQFIIH